MFPVPEKSHDAERLAKDEVIDLGGWWITFRSSRVMVKHSIGQSGCAKKMDLVHMSQICALIRDAFAISARRMAGEGLAGHEVMTRMIGERLIARLKIFYPQQSALYRAP